MAKQGYEECGWTDILTRAMLGAGFSHNANGSGKARETLATARQRLPTLKDEN